MFVDTVTGTVISGPIYWVDDSVDLSEMSDSEVIAIAQREGAYVASHVDFVEEV